MNSRETPISGRIQRPVSRIRAFPCARRSASIRTSRRPPIRPPSEHVPDLDPDYLFDRETTLAILAGFAFNRRVMITGYHGTGKSTHIEQVAARLNWPCVRINLDSHVSRIDLVGKDAIVLQGRHAGDRVPRRHAALGAAEQHRALLRRIRRGPARRDVRDPARARSVRQADAARSGARHPAASGLPHVRHRQHGRARRHLGPLSRHSADQPGPDGPLVDRRDAELPAARQGGRHRAGQGASLSGAQGGPRRRQQDGACGGPHPQRLHQRRPLDRDEPAHGHHLGRERRDLQGHRLRLPPHLPQQVRRARALAGGGVLPALPSARTCRRAR